MALPLPRVVADVGPGGGIVTARRGINALTQSNLENQIKKVQAQYAPITVPAEAASKLAYANLMGPQFLAKLMGNEDILANMTPEQRGKALNMVYQAGSGQTSGNSLGGRLNNPLSPISNVLNKLKNSFGFGGQNSNQQSSNGLVQQRGLAQQDRSTVDMRSPDQPYVMQGNQVSIPQPIPQPTQSPDQNTFAENVGTYGGIKEEGKEAGRIRAKEVNELSNTVFTGQTKQATLDQIGNILSSPIFEQIRQTPILGHHELSYYARYGTPEQQNIVGQLRTLSGNVIRDASQDFKGAFRKGEQQLLEDMKINPGDTVDAARGKMEQLSYLNKMITERARLTAKYMNQYHINKLQAEELADKQLNGDKIRSVIHNKLNPKPTDDDIQFMAEKYKISTDEVKKRLKAKGLL